MTLIPCVTNSLLNTQIGITTSMSDIVSISEATFSRKLNILGRKLNMEDLYKHLSYSKKTNNNEAEKYATKCSTQVNTCLTGICQVLVKHVLLVFNMHFHICFSGCVSSKHVFKSFSNTYGSHNDSNTYKTHV